MKGFRTLLRTTAFKIVAAYLALFVLFAFFVIGWLNWNTQRLMTDQITETVESEVRGLLEQFQAGGVRGLVVAVEQRSRGPSAMLYLVTSFTGEGIAGNVAELAPGALGRPGWAETSYQRLDETEGETHRALVRVDVLPGGFRLLVGRDLEERDRVRQFFGRGFRLTLVVALVFGVAGAYFVTRRVLKRVDAMRETSQRIMAGDLSGRLPVAGTNDELDRLADGVNAMLSRIEALMAGLKEVSDNIAHDLKTPLTRLRNRAEGALASASGDEAHKAALADVIAESDTLIRTFDALLMIARAEAGGQREGMQPIDLAEVAHSVAELYEPAAEEKGGKLLAATKHARVVGNRELLGRAIANLVDNALKYGVSTDGAPDIAIAVDTMGGVATLTVSDRGPGIPESDRQRVLGRFVRLETSRSRPGSGLGLSLAAAVAKLHGGEISIADNGPGLRVTLSLPLVAAVS